MFTCVRYASRFAFGSHAQTFIEIIYLLIFLHHCKNMKVSMNAITRSSTCFLRQRERGEVSVWKSMLHCILFNIFTCQFHSSAFVHFNCWSCQQLHSRSSQIIGWDEAWVQGGHSNHHNTEWTVPYPTHHLNWKMSHIKWTWISFSTETTCRDASLT